MPPTPEPSDGASEGNGASGAPPGTRGPQRTCIGCRKVASPADLVRVTRTVDGGLLVGRTLPGRGAWLCPDRGCVEAARKRKAFGRALRGFVADAAVDDLGVGNVD